MLGSRAPIAVRAGEDHADGELPETLGERDEEAVDRHVLLPRLAFADDQGAGGVFDVGSRGHHVHMVRKDRCRIHDFQDGHRRAARQDVRQHAFLVPREVLHDDERHAGIVGQALKQLAKGVEAARGRADADHAQRLPFGCDRAA